MLKRASQTDVKRIENFCRRYPLGVRISCQMNAYGVERDFLKVWFSESDNNINAVLCSFDSSITLCADENADSEELKAFVLSVGYYSLCAEKSVFEKCGFPLSSSRNMFIYRGIGGEYPKVGMGGSLKKVYDLISEAIPDSFSKEEEAYLQFLSDFTFRQRRNFARLKTICVGGKVVSCALTAAESDASALISGVACDFSYRNKGYGKNTVLALANELKKENKDVYVIALNKNAEKFYEKIGFEKCITVCYSEK